MLKIPKTSHNAFQKLMGVKQEPWEREKNLWKLVEKHVPKLAKIPGITFVGVCNSLSMNACHQNSDIDLFIIAKKNRLWSVRILTTLYFSLLRIRKTQNTHADRFCLSFFITENALDFSDIALKNDIYLYFWIAYMKPVINRDETYERFLEANMSWCDFDDYSDILKQAESHLLIQERGIQLPPVFSKLWDRVESSLKKIFLPRTQKSYADLGKPFWVIISDDMLKFHDEDRRKEVREKIML